ncbi:hypothetical protein A2U01_0086393, partial [Trifolium medium]|nr:hypothetical protein [Trifolium medium]
FGFSDAVAPPSGLTATAPATGWEETQAERSADGKRERENV